MSRPEVLLPRRTLQVIQPPMVLDDTIDPTAVATAIRTHFVRFDLAEGDAEIALAFRWSGAPSHRRLAGFARGIVEALPRTVAAGRSVFVMVDADVAQTLGAILKNEIGIASEVLVLDGIVLWDFDYVDLECMPQSSAVPVTIRSLIFQKDPRVPKARRGHDDRQPSP